MIQFFTGSLMVLIHHGYGFLIHSMCYSLYGNCPAFPSSQRKLLLILQDPDQRDPPLSRLPWAPRQSPWLQLLCSHTVFPFSNYSDYHAHSSVKFLVFISVTPIVRTLRAGTWIRRVLQLQCLMLLCTWKVQIFLSYEFGNRYKAMSM